MRFIGLIAFLFCFNVNAGELSAPQVAVEKYFEYFNNKDKNLTNSTEENPFLKKLSSLFSNNKNKNIVDEIEQADDVYPLKNTIKNETYDQKNKPLIDLNKNSTETINNSEQISLLDIDENEKTDNMDDVLEIPAFLRRQANWQNGQYKEN